MERNVSPTRGRSPRKTALLSMMGLSAGLGPIGVVSHRSPLRSEPRAPATPYAHHDATESYLQQLTDDLLNEKRARKHERLEYEATIRRLEDKLLNNSSALHGSAEAEKTLHLRQRLGQLQEQYEFRKHEILRLQEDVQALAVSKDGEKATALDAQRTANLKIEELSHQVVELQGKLQHSLNDSLASAVVTESCLAEHLDSMLPDVFGLRVADIPASEVEQDIVSLQADPDWDSDECFTGCVRVLVPDPTHPTASRLCEGDIVLKVGDTEVASTVHLQALLALSGDETTLLYRRGATKRTIVLSPAKPVSPSLTDCKRLCKLTGGMVSLLSDYKTHNVRVAEQQSLELRERKHLEEMLERERQEVVDLKRMLEAGKVQQKQKDHTRDMKLVAVNAKLSQEKKLLNVRLNRAVEDRSRLEEELRKAKAALSQLESTQGGEAKPELEMLETNLGTAKNELEATKGELEATKGELSAAHAELEAATTQNSTLMDQVAVVQGRVQQLTGVQGQTQSVLGADSAQREAAYKQLEAEATGLRGQVTELSSELANIQSPSIASLPEVAVTHAATHINVGTPSLRPAVATISTHMSEAPLKEAWQRSGQFEKVTTPAMSYVSVRSVRSVQGGYEDAMEVLEQMAAVLPESDMLDRVMGAVAKAAGRVEGLIAKVAAVASKLKAKDERINKLEVECQSLKAAAEELMGRLEGADSPALAQAESELLHASSLIASQQHKITQLETMLADTTAAALRPVSPKRLPPAPAPAPLPVYDPYVEVEVISHHTRILESVQPPFEPPLPSQTPAVPYSFPSYGSTAPYSHP